MGYPGVNDRSVTPEDAAYVVPWIAGRAGTKCIMTRDDVINAAFHAWGRELYKTTSLAMVAETLGVSKSALYRHFLGKETLLEAMADRFYDDYAAALKPVIEEALGEPLWKERLVIMVRFISSYFARHFDYFIYSLMRLHGRREQHVFNIEALTHRGISFEGLGHAGVDRQDPSSFFLAGITALFGTALFHKRRRSLKGPFYAAVVRAAPFTSAPEPRVHKEPSAKEVRRFTAATANMVRYGLAFDRALVDGLPYEKLEALDIPPYAPPDPLLKAAAEADLWNGSMETVARRSGLSKSGLYAHFKSKTEMFSRLFMSEFERIAGCAAASVVRGESREEQLYLAILAIAGYLRDRPEILTALDWVRIQRLELDLSVPPVLHEFFAGLNLDISQEGAWENLAQWTLFLIVAVLMRWHLFETPADCLLGAAAGRPARGRGGWGGWQGGG
ncbi:MAG: TetR/AcrR family transcriptional regulator, partial [Treponema sp.]|nr:TetR/AcrR family transcriptional regulator [Treponema sp.]